MKTKNKQLVADFMEVIWNNQDFDRINDFLHPDFADHSLPPSLPANASGLKLWVTGTSEAFKHHSVIDEHVTESDKSIIKFRMLMEHIGVWRDIQPTGIKLSAVGYRCFRIEDGMIREHWALLDGNSIENQLKEASQGCKLQN